MKSLMKEFSENMPVGSVVEIDWIDAISLESKDKKTNWIKISEVKKHCNKLLIIKSVGKLVCIGKFYLALAIHEKRNHIGVNCLIPLSAIVEARVRE